MAPATRWATSILYGTTRLFLERFGLKSLRELPPLEDFAPDEESKQFIRERLSGRQMESTLEDAMDDIEDERELLGDGLGESDDETGFSPDEVPGDGGEGVSEDA